MSTAPPARHVALLGTGFAAGEDGPLDRWLLGLARAPRPRVCFVPTASGDAEGYVERFRASFGTRRDCETAVLPLFRRELDDAELRDLVLAQDVVYVGGGNTANLLAVWRVHGLDRLLREAYDRGTLMCGVSAGANCWAQGCHTDSFGPLTFLPDGLGLLRGSVCPHYDTEAGRRDSYRSAVATGALPADWALDDGAAALFTDGRLTEAVTRTPGARVYRVEPDGEGGTTERPVPCGTLHGA